MIHGFFSVLAGINEESGPAPQNLMAWSEAINEVGWILGGCSVTPNTTLAPDGTTTADTITSTSSLQAARRFVSVNENTLYTFSFHVMRGTMTDMKYSIYRNNSPVANIIAPTSYFSLTNGSDFERLAFEFTTPAGCTEIAAFVLRDSGSTGTCFVWGAQINEGPLRPYTKTEGSIVP